MSFRPERNTALSSALAANGGPHHAVRLVVTVPFGGVLLSLRCSLGPGSAVTAHPAVRTTPWMLMAPLPTKRAR